jgi:hypothetical protein
MRRPHPGEGAKRPEARYHPEGAAVDAPGVWHEGHASYPGRSVVPPPATGVLPQLPNWRPDFGILSAKAESLQGATRRKRM